MIPYEVGQVLHVLGLTALWALVLAGLPALIEWIGGDPQD